MIIINPGEYMSRKGLRLRVICYVVVVRGVCLGVSNDSYGWHLQYFTIIGLSLATATFAFGLLADLTLSRRLASCKNTLSVASAPMECLISVLYWGLRAVSRKWDP